MQIYLVGGAVRDKLLGLPVKERDWVVVGATPQEMLAKGFRQVGRDFPVFLHPKTKEEYALARTERKVGKGYRGFVCNFDPTVTLENDLKRRDLTINAIAQDKNGKLIDPYGGLKDLNKKILRHVSSAFTEDPVRILRVARFAARFGDFRVSRATTVLMQSMVANHEVDALVPERVWQEFERALQEQYPERFFMVLHNAKALQTLFPEINPHLNFCRKILTLAVKVKAKNTIRFAVLFSKVELDAVKSFCKRYRVPAAYKDLAILLVKHQNEFKQAKKLNSHELLHLLEQTDALRRPERFNDFLQACSLISSNHVIPYLQKAYKIIAELPLNKVLEEKTSGQKIKQQIHKLRQEALDKYFLV